ncbi:MAG: tetratricopeptide repeat protein [Candidatus Sericytochromatia bacterium]
MAKIGRVLALGVALALWAPSVQAAALDALYFEQRLDGLERAARALLADSRKDNDAEAHAWLSRAYTRHGRLDRARAALRQAGTASLAGVLAHGDYALFTGDYPAARAHFERAVTMAPKDVHALWGLAAALLALREYERAEQAAARAHAGAGSLPPSYRSQALAIYGGVLGLRAQAGFVDAVTAGPRARGMLEQAVALAPNNPYARFALGRFYLAAPGYFGGGADKAVAELRRAVALNPHYFPAHAFLIQALHHAEQGQQAARELAAYRRKFAGSQRALQELEMLLGSNLQAIKP